jgi:hypothetical protein
MVECNLAKVDVVGSSPIARSKTNADVDYIGKRWDLSVPSEKVQILQIKISSF